MQINYTVEAFSSLIRLINFIEKTNTEGAGVRWLDRFEIFLQSKLSTAVKISLCNNLTFQRLNLRCIYYSDWVIAFSLSADQVLIEALIHKSRITD
jgi:hypothetical protein